MKRRDFLHGSLLGFGGLIGSQLPVFASTIPTPAQSEGDSPSVEVKGAILNVHDPVIIKQDDYYYLFCTGVGIPVRRSKDMIDWRIARGGNVFQKQPEEAFAYVPDATNIWAPDISYYNDQYHLYYAVSTFGSNHSAIGLATNKTLDHDDPAFKWVDEGVVFKSDRPDDYNAIDPNLILDADGVPWLAFGSFWGGIKMIRLDYATGKQSPEDQTVYSLAWRPEMPHAIEGAFIIYRNNYYYLFVSFDACCQGVASTYNVRVGRSETITGPYADRDDVPMMEGGGTQITFPTKRYVGPGHNGIFSEGDQDYIVYHAYDVVQGGIPTLRIDPLAWDENNFPYIPGMQAES